MPVIRSCAFEHLLAAYWTQPNSAFRAFGNDIGIIGKYNVTTAPYVAGRVIDGSRGADITDLHPDNRFVWPALGIFFHNVRRA
jgi:hypothetical protein